MRGALRRRVPQDLRLPRRERRSSWSSCASIGRGLREQRLDFAHMKIAARRRGIEPSRPRAAYPLRAAASRWPSRSRSCRARPLSATGRGPLVIEEFDATIVVPPDATAQRTPSATSSCDFGPSHEDRSHHLRRHQERARFDRRRHGLHGGAHRPLRDRQGRDGFLRRAVRRRRADGGAGQDHRPASGRHPRGHGRGARQVRRRSRTRATSSS